MEANYKILNVIVPVYNTGQYLERCLDSILNQSFKEFNIIIIDDGSTDNSFEICEAYAKKYINITLIHTQNQGLSSARNLGISMSNSKYLSFIDSDDWIEEEMYEKLLEDALKYDADISACNMYSAKTETIRREKNEMTNFNGESSLVFYDENVLKAFYKLFSVCNKIFKKELFKDIKFPDKQIFEDAKIMYKISGLSKIATFNSYNGYNYFQRNDGIIGTLSLEKMYDRVLMWNDIASYVLERLPEEYDYIVSRKDKAILELISIINNDIDEKIYLKILREMILPNENNKYLTTTEKQRILELTFEKRQLV